MALLRDIRRRINAVRNTQQITRAMYMVATARLRQTEERVKQARPYSAELASMLARLVAHEESAAGHPLLEQREVERVTYVIVTADRGLCGSYNANLIREAEQTLKDEKRPYELIIIGRKGRDYFRRQGAAIFREYTELREEIDYRQATGIAGFLADRFLAGQTDQVTIQFTRFKTALAHEIQTRQLLPIAKSFGEEQEAEEGDGLRGERPEHFFEPSAKQLFAELLPKYLQNQLYHMLLESKASEHGARMTAMKNATDNAEELIETLTLDFNRARQAAITREITEIVGGAEAIKQG
jgi:F-type H+-transporting ATPase subunit gamma